MDGVRGYPREQPDDLWRPPSETAEPAAGDPDAVPFPQQRLSAPAPPQPPRAPRQRRRPRATPRTTPLTRPPRGPLYGSPLGPHESYRINEDLDLDELDPRGGARERATVKAALILQPRRRRRQVFRITSGVCAVIVLTIAGLGTYAYQHLFGQVATESLDALSNRPAASRADRYGNTPLNLLLLGSQTRDGQHGSHLGNASKLGTDISDTAMLVHISAERKWATVVSIPRDLVAPRPQCPGRLDPAQTVPAAQSAMFDLAMNLGGPTCAVATVEQLTGIRIDHFVEITFNAFQALTDAVGGVTVCVPPPGINDPDYSGLVLSPGLHTVSGSQSLAFVRDRHGLADGTDLNRIRMQQMFVTSLFNKLASAGTLGDPITLYRIANAVTSNLTVDTGLDSLDAMVGLAGSVQSLQSHYIQFITVPYAFDPTNQNRVVPGPGFDQVWTDLRQDTPLPGSNAARAFGTAPKAASGPPAPTPTLALTGTQVDVYNSTQVPHLALYASQNLTALGVDARVEQGSPFGADPQTRLLYPAGIGAQADSLAARFGGSAAVQPVQSDSVRTLTLVIGVDPPTSLVAEPGASAGTPTPDGSSAGSAAPAPDASISAESRSGDENICSDLPGTVGYGGRP
ncbi:LCP family protein [Actinospica robiniae]|uniref:LCP family protein n=1 Tax=Actinospica robiniae TaxID=304901 RepID=UPI000688AD32|nr:LCP family protein [Actinospica robiniae]